MNNQLIRGNLFLFSKPEPESKQFEKGERFFLRNFWGKKLGVQKGGKKRKRKEKRGKNCFEKGKKRKIRA